MRAGCREKSERRFAADTGSAEVCGSPMGEAALQGLLSERTFPRFAEEVAREVRDSGAVEVLYGLITERAEALPRAVRHRILFRGAYVLERIFFETPELFEPCIDRFCRRDFPACSDESMKRHFGKIMARLLLDYRPEEAVLERIAEAAARWAVEPRAKVAVRVWAVEVLLCCRGRVAWLTEIGDELLAAVGRDASPGIAVRMRKRWRWRSEVRTGEPTAGYETNAGAEPCRVPLPRVLSLTGPAIRCRSAGP